ncbi:hypothetical protein D0962_06680 [Leptolyngbyaceae cyanobacterium CCMR0082]|uniref:Uncharacterized protein n=1 Tax=Adonisia turfae CCMR0082 TaxID=2304604 RepID=A0A6M0S207_9CYAN|nr:hypothetical protein [Adonisia turfae]NEZ62468.1 hypothetical protein [Adonisia turfae CCMR0082]
MAQRDDFYIGYAPVPPSVRRLLLWFIPVLVLCVLGLAIIAPPLHFDQANPGQVIKKSQVFEGLLLAEPSPHLLVPNPEVPDQPFKVYPLSGLSKMLPGAAVMKNAGSWVKLEGTLVRRPPYEMLAARSAETIDIPAGAERVEEQTVSLGEFAIAGEIVDGKCYPGIMKPGRTKTHRACAIRCISGGVPPVFRSENSSGQSLYFMLSDLKGEAVNSRVLNMVADPIKITGEVMQYGDSFILKADPATYERLPA